MRVTTTVAKRSGQGINYRLTYRLYTGGVQAPYSVGGTSSSPSSLTASQSPVRVYLVPGTADSTHKALKIVS